MAAIGSYTTGPNDDRRFFLSSFAAMTAVAAFLLAAISILVVSTNSNSGTSGAAGSGGPTKLQVTLSEMKITPVALEAAAGRITIEVTNTGALPHNLAIPALDKRTADLAGQGKATLDLGEVPAGTYQVICEVPGHDVAGMKATLTVTGDSTAKGAGAAPAPGAHAGPVAQSATPSGATIDPQATPVADWKPFDPRLVPAAGGTEHVIEVRATEVVKEVAPGVIQELWTFNDQYPGPVLRGKVGDLFTVHLRNDGKLGHSIDFHASQVAMNDEMRTIAPGESLTYQFRAEFAGMWMYHCGTGPALHHIGNGMFGAVIIDPPNLAPVDHEFVFVQSELYLGEQGKPGDLAKMIDEKWDAVVFNGYHNQYKHAPIRVEPGQRIRAWVLDAGPSENSSFHVVGTIFDTVFEEGRYVLRPGNAEHGGSQALALQPAQGGFVEFALPETGLYAMVTHKFANVGKGALGLFQAGEVHATGAGH